MKDKELIRVVTGFRKGLLGKSDPSGQCFAVSTALGGYLNFCGYKTDLEEAEIVFGEDVYHHWYLRDSKGRVIDATASQFNGMGLPDMPQVYIGELPNYYKLFTQAKLDK